MIDKQVARKFKSRCYVVLSTNPPTKYAIEMPALRSRMELQGETPVCHNLSQLHIQSEDTIHLFWSKVNFLAPNGCWEWKGGIRYDGYGRTNINGKLLYAHRIAYEFLVGAVPKGKELDHLCRNPPCVNPSHLEPVTHRENILRGMAFSAVHARKTHCPKGHEYTADNLVKSALKRGQRNCKECKRERDRVYSKIRHRKR